ncbi:hypothetical protein EII18_03510 [Comamonadaceae bacterium OH3737_COT-264]|nr:hypothetical protein EII18_03510 [Comamonadaceae bacterium OH3737_COT-264]
MHSAGPEPSPRPAPWRRRLRWSWRWGMRALLALALLAAAALAALHGWLLPQLDQWRPELERAVSRASGLPVRIGALRAESPPQGWALLPTLIAHDVHVGQAGDALHVQVAQVELGVSLPSLARLGWDSLRLHAPHMVVSWADGGDAPAALPWAAVHWLLDQPQVLMEQGRLTVHPPDGQAEPLVLEAIDLALERTLLGRHTLALRLQPHAMGTVQLQADLQVDLQAEWAVRLGHHPHDWPLLQGPVHLQVHGADVQAGFAAALAHWPALAAAWPGAVPQGRMDAHLQVQLEATRGQQHVREADLDARWHALQVPGPAAQPLLAWDEARLQLHANGPQPHRPAWQVTQAQLEARRGRQQWRSGPLSAVLDYRPATPTAPGHWRRLELHAPQWDLAFLAALGAPAAPHPPARPGPAWPEPPRWQAALAQVQQHLARWQPTGVLRDVRGHWQREPSSAGTELSQWALTATLEGVGWGMEPAAGVPLGVRQLSGAVQAQDGGGQAQLHMDDGAVHLPTVFEQALIPVQTLRAQVQWQHSADGHLAVQVQAPQVRNAHAQGSATVRWRTATQEEMARYPGLGRWPGHLDLQAQLTRADAAQTWRYLPLSIPEAARHYVRDSVRQGRGQKVAFEVRGLLRDFPFDGARSADAAAPGRFRIEAEADQIAYRYVPHALLAEQAGGAQGQPQASAQASPQTPPHAVWPDLADVKARLLFEGYGMHIDVHEGRLQAVPQVRIGPSQARIEDFRRAHLQVQATAQGPLQPQLQLLATTPAARMTGHALDEWRGTGEIGLQLALGIPLDVQPSGTQQGYTVAGQVRLQGNDIHGQAHMPSLYGAQGTVHFSEKGFTAKGITAQALGGPVQLEVHMPDLEERDAPTRVQVQARGRFSAEGVQRYARQALGAGQGLADRLLAGLHGASDYTLDVHTLGARAFIDFASSTQGLGSRLPAPLHKAADAVQPLRLTHTPPNAEGDEWVELDWGERLYARYRLRRSAPSASPPTPTANAPEAKAKATAKTTTTAAPAAPDWQVREGAVLIGAFSDDERRLSRFIPHRFAPAPVPGHVRATIAWEGWDASAWLPWLQGPQAGAAASNAPQPIEQDAAKAPEKAAASAAAANSPTTARPDGATQARPPPPAAPPSNPSSAPSAWPAGLGALIPSVWYGQFQRLQWGEMTLHDVAVQAYQNGGAQRPFWVANIHAAEMQGQLEYHPHYLDDTGLLRGKFARVELPADFGQTPASDADAAHAKASSSASADWASVRRLPTVDLEIDRLLFAGRDWGQAALQAVNHMPGGLLPHEWRINYLTLHVPEARLHAQGSWRAARQAQPVAHLLDGHKVMDMRFTLEVDDAGRLLSRLGWPGVLHAGKGTLHGRLGWRGSPFKLDLPTLGGSFHLDMQKGQFLQVDAGAARLLGVLSLQALPRRLSLDFRDIFSDGFAFDFVRGDVQLQEGKASTNNVQMQGVNAGVVLEGQADVLGETQDIKVTVVPELDAMTASLVATAINPAVGAGTFLAQLFLGKPLAQSAAREFHIHGAWSAPIVERVQRHAEPRQTTMPEAGDGP